MPTMSAAVSISLVTLLAVLLLMAGEAALSAHNESALRARGALEPPEDIFTTMRWAYPLCFAAMALEGALNGPPPRDVLAAGLAVLGFAKALKIWVIGTLGPRWTFRVLVLPGEPLVGTGPYRVLRHPNYLAVVGELVGMALVVWAPVVGLLSVAGFGLLLWRRIRVEDTALGRQ